MSAKILLISPYHGGSHRAWATGYQQYSQHQVQLLTLPARFWKWRMHGGAVTLARQYLAENPRPDLILATDMLNVTTFLALTRPGVPLHLYMHENQLTYPLPANSHSGPMRRQKGERDLHYAFINYASMLAADHVHFNSAYHRHTFLAELPRFLRHFPEYNELDTVAELAARSSVLPVGLDLARLAPPATPVPPAGAPLILWNQRWEYDKNPAGFFHALYTVAAEGIPFRLALCGENFRRHPTEFNTALTRLRDQICHVGYANEADYRHLLHEAAITISTAHHEFFGISILEAIACHTFPILPHRLSYPELIPPPFHHRCLYENQGGLLQRLRWALANPAGAATIATQLAQTVTRFDWATLAPVYDTTLIQMAG